MASQRSNTTRVRLFVAIDLPKRVRLEIARWGESELRDPALRAVAPEALHITLAFLGSRESGEVEIAAEAVRACVGEAPQVALRGPQARPRQGPRIFALPASSPGLEALQADLQLRLVAKHLYEPGKRPFWPHVTVARVRSERGAPRRPMAVRRAPQSLPPALTEAFFCRRLTLYRSELQPSGARYLPLAQIELPGAGRQ